VAGTIKNARFKYQCKRSFTIQNTTSQQLLCQVNPEGSTSTSKLALECNPCLVSPRSNPQNLFPKGSPHCHPLHLLPEKSTLQPSPPSLHACPIAAFTLPRVLGYLNNSGRTSYIFLLFIHVQSDSNSYDQTLDLCERNSSFRMTVTCYADISKISSSNKEYSIVVSRRQLSSRHKFYYHYVAFCCYSGKVPRMFQFIEANKTDLVL
jgi:hypothetical protein